MFKDKSWNEKTELERFETLADEFPEFIMAFAEENFLRGYQLGLDDATRIPKAES